MDASNRITGSPDPSVIKGIAPVQKSGPVLPATEKTAAVPKGDRVEISARAREMQAAREMIRKMPDVDEEKVARIKAQIQAGTYQVDSRRIASGILVESLLLEKS